MTTQEPCQLYGTEQSGHTHRVAWLLRILGRPYTLIPTPMEARRTPEFLALNPYAQVPVLRDGPVVLSDSNAILVYLATRYDAARRWLPEAPLAQAAVQRWLSVAAGEIAFGPARARMLVQFLRSGDPEPARQTAARILSFMDAHLARQAYLAGPEPTLADLACYAYCAHAPEGGIALEPYANLRAWLARAQQIAHFQPMPALPIPVAA